jgi:3-oxoadipate enol-lactonase
VTGGRTLDVVTTFRLPWLPEGRLIRTERGELFVRVHRHADPHAPAVLLLHGWTASSDLQFFTAYEALAEHFTFVGIDHRGHGRGLRSPNAFALEDAADDAAAAVRHLGLDPVITVGYSMGGPVSLHLARRHPGLVAGIVVQATGLEWSGTWRERALWRVFPVFGSWLRSRGYRWYLNRAVPKVVGVDNPDVEPYVPWLVSEMSRNDSFAMVDAGRALSRYDARSWASSLGVPAASLITTGDRLVRPSKQRALAQALGASRRELAADHLAPLSHPRQFAALTVELVELIASRRPRHLDQRVAEGDTAAPLGERVVGERVGGPAVGVLRHPPAEGDGGDAGTQPLGHADRQLR